jgi:hypothetical protein
MEGVPDDEISLSVLLYSVHGCSIFVVLGLSFMVAVGMVSWAGVGTKNYDPIRCRGYYVSEITALSEQVMILFSFSPVSYQTRTGSDSSII